MYPVGVNRTAESVVRESSARREQRVANIASSCDEFSCAIRRKFASAAVHALIREYVPNDIYVSE